MIPVFFGSSRRRLFGVYHAARAGVGGRKSVLICYPWGHEYIPAHRSLTKLAENLAEAGFHVFRFDYFGTGDSGGECEEGSISGWLDDINAAEVELKDMSGAEDVSVIGLRFGAYLAARKAAQSPRSTKRLVLWDPVISGKEYVDSLFQTASNMPIGARPPPKRPAEIGGGHEICGFPLTEAMEAEMRRLDLLPHIREYPNDLLVIESTNLDSHDQFRVALHERKPMVDLEHIECRAAWREDWPNNAGVVPVQALQRIVEWMT
ncbi:alpha/beta hydrolase [Ruegeria sp. 2012CJ41-6]|uniref:Alpha/beta hydrolase n=1 Tax=Ruegeria spongiae TaxID=2942209 RepID=A0ABT0Q5I2_9RHOB|nr:alpha/beta fold hydrolase [Ruegeria spongiae]MCL6285130.1 alpha/beta hydrolase [Ruegeria spongiae]